MKTLIWVLFAVVLGLWTGLVVTAIELADWAVQALGSGQVEGWVAGAANAPVPGWIGAWLDPSWVGALQQAALAGLQWLTDGGPSLEGMMVWMRPLIWTGWGLMALLLLLAAGALHWFAGRLSQQPLRHAKP